MIQVHTIDGIEAAISLGVLLPPDCKVKSRHRFWIGQHRVDAYINRERTIFIHWLNRATLQHEHPRQGGMRRALLYANGSQFFEYEGEGWKKEFRPSLGQPERNAGGPL